VTRRDPEGARRRILDAARAEFAAKGLAGARVDAIAEAAGVNKRMLYHYFGNKDALFRAVLHATVLQHGDQIEGNPPDPVDALPLWYDAISADVPWIRLLAWEALEAPIGADRADGAAELRLNYLAAVGWIRDAQRAGLLSPDLDPELYLLATIALNMFPDAFPQVTRSVTAQSPRDESFRRRWRAFLGRLGPRLRPAPGDVARPGGNAEPGGHD
jgi:AcrR family transcriptional regulator